MSTDRIPKAGSWVMIRSLIPVEIPIPPLSIWWAKATGFVNVEGARYIWSGVPEKVRSMGYDEKRVADILDKGAAGELRPDEKGEYETYLRYFHRAEQQIRVRTPFGDVSIWPEEYTIVKDIKPYLEEVKSGHVQVKYMSNISSGQSRVSDIIFYARSRGISMTDALIMALTEVKDWNLFYLLMHPEYIRTFNRNADSYFDKEKQFIEYKKSVGIEVRDRFYAQV